MNKIYSFTDGKFDDFFNLWIAGQAEFGDYFHFVNSWLAKKHLPNVFIITYEFMKNNQLEAIRKVAHFMDEKYGKMIDQDDQLLQKIAKNSSVTAMKTKYDDPMESQTSTGFILIRKGQINDWKSIMTEEENQLISQRFREEAKKAPYLMQLWDDYSWLNDKVSSN